MKRFGQVAKIVHLSIPSVIQRSFTTSSAIMAYPVNKSEAEWRAVLSPAQFQVIREKGTERAGTGEYDHHFENGVYNCAACDSPLYKSETKFDSGCGWPAFYEAIPGSIELHTDSKYGMVRTEMVCANCGGHLGHVFKGEGFKTPTDERHCVNSVSLRFSGR
jgi:peptide-methionine (R)-S-oxide reductase